jgi:hypothetical protein
VLLRPFSSLSRRSGRRSGHVTGPWPEHGRTAACRCWGGGSSPSAPSAPATPGPASSAPRRSARPPSPR